MLPATRLTGYPSPYSQDSESSFYRLLIKPGRRTAEELQRRAKILLQVAPDWKERTAPVNARLTPEEERKVMELINQPKS